MKIAVVILNWNGKQILEEFLPTVINYSKEANIYVADNASTDSSVAYINKAFPEVKIIQNSINGGFAKGYNDALKSLKEDIFCLLNNDIEVTKDWLIPIFNYYKNDNGYSILQPKILDYKNKTKFEYAGAAGGFLDKFGYPFCRGRIFNTIEEDTYQYDKKNTIFWASGACLFLNSSLFKQLNGFDESYFAHMEEIDLCWRAQNLGHSVKYIPKSIVYHVGGATLKNVNPKKTYLNFRNSLYTLVKNARGPIIFLVLIRLVLDAVAGIKFMLEFKPKHTFAIIQAHFAFYSRLPILIKQRKSNPHSVKYFHKTSIVWSYFIKKKTTFNSL